MQSKCIPVIPEAEILMSVVRAQYYILLFILLYYLSAASGVTHETRAGIGVSQPHTSLCWPLTTLLSSGLSGLLSWKYSTAFWILAMLPRYSSSLPVGLERRRAVLARADGRWRGRTKGMVFENGRTKLTQGTPGSYMFYPLFQSPLVQEALGMRPLAQAHPSLTIFSVSLATW